MAAKSTRVFAAILAGLHGLALAALCGCAPSMFQKAATRAPESCHESPASGAVLESRAACCCEDEAASREEAAVSPAPPVGLPSLSVAAVPARFAFARSVQRPVLQTQSPPRPPLRV